MAQSSGLFTYKGVNFLSGIYNLDYLESLQEFEIRDDDVFVVTYPKSGTTWLQYILSSIYHGDELHTGSGRVAAQMVPFLEVGNQFKEDFTKMPSPRAFVTHLPLSMLPKGLNTRGKVIYMIRNPKDVAISFFHFHNFFRVLESQPNFDEFLELFLQGETFIGSWFEHTKSCLRHSNDINDILFVTYEEFIKDRHSAVVKLLNFVGKELSNQAIETLVEQCSFKSMKDNMQVNYTKWRSDMFDFTKGSMLRRGKVGEWRAVFTEAQNERFDLVYEEKMKDLPLNIEWDLEIKD